MLVGALDTFVLISVHFPVGFMGNSAIVIPFSPGVRRVIAPPFSERTRALREWCRNLLYYMSPMYQLC